MADAVTDTADYNVDAHIRRLTIGAIAHTRGSRTDAAKLLGISIRTLRNWIHRYGLSRVVPPPPQRQRKN